MQINRANYFSTSSWTFARWVNQMSIIIRSVLAIAVVTAALCLTVPASRADAPWCAVVSLGNGNAYWDCRYRTIEECTPNVLGGNRGFCNQSPWYTAEKIAFKKSRATRSHRE